MAAERAAPVVVLAVDVVGDGAANRDELGAACAMMSDRRTPASASMTPVSALKARMRFSERMSTTAPAAFWQESP